MADESASSTTAPAEASPSERPTLKLRPMPATSPAIAPCPIAEGHSEEPKADTGNNSASPFAAGESSTQRNVDKCNSSRAATQDPNTTAADYDSVKSEASTPPPPSVSISDPTPSTNASTAATSTTSTSNTSTTCHNNDHVSLTTPPIPVANAMAGSSTGTAPCPIPSGEVKPKERLFGVESRAAVIEQARSLPGGEIVCIDCDIDDDDDDADSLFGESTKESRIEKAERGPGKRPAQDEQKEQAKKKRKLFHSLSLSAEDAGGGLASRDGHDSLPPILQLESDSAHNLANGEKDTAPVASTAEPAAVVPKSSRLPNHDDDEGSASFSIPAPAKVAAVVAGTAAAATTATATTRGGFILDDNDDDADTIPEDDDTLFRAVVWKRPGAAVAEAVPNATVVDDHSGITSTSTTSSSASSSGSAGAGSSAGSCAAITPATAQNINISRYPQSIQDRIGRIRAQQAEKEIEKEQAASVERQKKQAAEKSRRMREETVGRRRNGGGSGGVDGGAVGAVGGVSVGVEKNSAVQGVKGGLTAAFLESDDDDAVRYAAAASTSSGSKLSDSEAKRPLHLTSEAEDLAPKAPRHAKPARLDPAAKEAKRAAQRNDDVPTNAAVRAKQDIESIKRTSALPMALQRGLVPARGVGLLDQIAENRRGPMGVSDMLAPAGVEAKSRHFHPGMRKTTTNGRSADAGSFKVPRMESVVEKMEREDVARTKKEEGGECGVKEKGARQAPSSNAEAAIPSALKDKIAKATKKLSDKDAAVVRDHELAKERGNDIEVLEKTFREIARLSCIIDAHEMNDKEIEKVFDFADLILEKKGVGYVPRMRVKAIRDNMARRVHRRGFPEPDDEAVEGALVEMVGEERLRDIETQYKEAQKKSERLKSQREANTAKRRQYQKIGKRDLSFKAKKMQQPKPRPEFHTGMAIAGKLGDYEYRGPEEEEVAMTLMRQQLAKLDQAKQMPMPAPALEQEGANEGHEDSESEESVDETGAEIYAGFGGPVTDTPVVPLPVKVAAPDVPRDSPKAVQMPSPPVSRVADPDSPKPSPTAVQMPSPEETSSEGQSSERNSAEHDADMEEESLSEELGDLQQVATCRFIVRAEFWNMAGNESDVFDIGRFHDFKSASARLLQTVEKYKCRCWVSPEMVMNDRYERPSIPESYYLVGWEKKDSKTQRVIEHGTADQLITDREQANADAAQLLRQWYSEYLDTESGEFKMTIELLAERYQKEDDADGLFEYSGSMVLNDGTVEEMHVRVKELRTRQIDHGSSE